MLESFTEACRQDERVLAAFVGGSVATAKADEFSDLDLYAIIQPDVYDRFLEEHRQFMERLGEPVFLEYFDGFGFDMFVFIFDNGIHGELGIAKPNSFLHIHGGPFKTLVDKQGLLEAVEFPWQRPSEAQQVKFLRRELLWFWRDLSLYAVAMGRGELWSAAGHLESMRRRCINLIRLDQDFDSWTGEYEKLERAVGQEHLTPLKGSFPAFDAQAIADSANALIAFYQRIASKLAKRHNLDYPHALEAVVLRQLAGSSAQGH